MSKTRKFHIYEHRDGEDCGDDTFGGRAMNVERTDVTKDSTPDCSGVGCENELVYDRTVETEASPPEPPQHRREFIDGLSDHERALMLGMAMESIRGNWTRLEKRLGIIEYICEVGVGDQLSDEFVDAAKGAAKNLWTKKQVPYLYPDGRRFRGSRDGRYGKLWDEVEKDHTKMRSIAGHLPHDMTWDAHKFDRIMEEDNE